MHTIIIHCYKIALHIVPFFILHYEYLPSFLVIITNNNNNSSYTLVYTPLNPYCNYLLTFLSIINNNSNSFYTWVSMPLNPMGIADVWLNKHNYDQSFMFIK